MLTADQAKTYTERGFLILDGILPQADIEQARAAVEVFVERSREVRVSDSAFDLAPGHTADEPRVRRLKNPCALHPAFERLAQCEALLDIVASLLGPDVRFQNSKLNMKSARFGSPIEWHQDFAFYPHTNDDLLAVGIAL